VAIGFIGEVNWSTKKKIHGPAASLCQNLSHNVVMTKH